MVHRYYVKKEVLDKAIKRALKYRKIVNKKDGDTYHAEYYVEKVPIDVEITPSEGAILFVVCIDALAGGNKEEPLRLSTMNQMNKADWTEGTFYIDEDRKGSIFYKVLRDKILIVPPRGEIFLYLEELVMTLKENISYIKNGL